METMYRAGLRVGEVVALEPKHVRIAEGIIEVRHSKRDKSRNIPIGPRLAEWLTKWAARRPADAKWFFCTLQGGQLSRSYLCEMTKREAEAAGLDRDQVSPHVFRHVFATERVADGFGIHEVARLLGHASIATTEVYLYVRQGDLAAKMAAHC
jgi:site-specific recombinase XerD